MTPRLKATLVKAIRQLVKERAYLDRQITGIQAVLETSDSGKSSAVKTRSRKTRRMSAAAKKRVSLRMKKYWAERRKAAAKSKGKNNAK
jgi:hypothetical protein